MGIERWKSIQKRQVLYTSQMNLAYAKICYLQVCLNIEMEEASENIDTLYKTVSGYIPSAEGEMGEIYKIQKELKESITELQRKNPELLCEVNDKINDL